jgi:hypothetical protein
MTNPDRPAPDAAVDAAIARVLDAEHKARDAVRDGEAEAAAMIELARASARALGERTERRIRGVRAAFEARTSATVAALVAEADAAGAAHELTAADLVRLDAAVAALAALLTGNAMQ